MKDLKPLNLIHIKFRISFKDYVELQQQIVGFNFNFSHLFNIFLDLESYFTENIFLFLLQDGKIK